MSGSALIPVAVEMVAGWLLAYALHSTLLLAAATLASRLLRSPAWRDTVWKVALVGGLVTASLPLPAAWRLTAPIGVVTKASSLTVERAARSAKAADGAAPAAALDPRFATGGSVGTGGVPPAGRPPLMSSEAGPAALAPPATPHATASRATAVGALALVGCWLAVAAAALLWRGTGYLRFLRGLRRRPEDDPALTATLDALARRLGLTRLPRVTRSAALEVPVALAGAEVCLPATGFDQLSAAQQRSILAHELAHVRRHDPLWLLAAELLATAFFFQPLNRLAQRRLKVVAEELCDDAAVAATGDPLPLVEGLAFLAGRLLQRHPRAVAAVVDGKESSLVRRVARVLAPAPRRGESPAAWVRTLVAAATCLFLALLAPGWAAVEAAPESAVEATAKAAGTTNAERRLDAAQPDAAREAARAAAVDGGASPAGGAGRSPRDTVAGDDRRGDSGGDRATLQVEYLDLGLSHTDVRDAAGNPTRLRLDARGVRVPRGGGAIVGIDPGGSFEAREERGGVVRHLRVEPTADGGLRRQFFVDERPRPFDRAAEEWLAGLLDVERFPVYYGLEPTRAWGVGALEAAALPAGKRIWNGADQRVFEREGAAVTRDIEARGVVLHPSQPRVLALDPGGSLLVRERQGELLRSVVITPAADGGLRIDSSCNLPEPLAEDVDAWLARILAEHLAGNR